MKTQQNWFITGASSGLGNAFARHALSQDHRIVATARSEAKLSALVALAPERALARSLDVTDTAQIERGVAEAIERFVRIDVLINNAGYGIVGAVEETPENELRAQMETNFFGAVAMARAVLPQMRSQRSGAIVNISSLGGQLSFAGFGAYSASKFALEGISEAMAQELAPFGIKVLIVEPGAFRTEFAGDALRHMPSLDAYRDVVGGTREFARGMHNTQAGDPDKAARAIDIALQTAHTPLRLQLGSDAISSVRAHAETLLKESAEWEPIALDTAFDASSS
jgi:NAD(P)-dependent dehydrogenase (short-subunit alcohol dehydrogenase family)